MSMDITGLSNMDVYGGNHFGTKNSGEEILPGVY